jgi:HCOMODA/2-hydroxy-3-carboxy-muconic semialdehyde decarboxylase
MMVFDLDGAAVNNDVRSPYLERFIHSAIYSSRPDVHAVVHSHSMSVIPFGVAKQQRLRPVCHMGDFWETGRLYSKFAMLPVARATC